jgi:AcrR family transcriptional regulator
MAYRHTEKTLARKAAVRESLLVGALAVVAEGGFGALTVVGAAQQAGMATGAVYKHFESKAALCAEVFRRATEKEVAMVRAAATVDAPPAEQLRQAIATFAQRALRGRRLAYALIAEPVDALVDAERLRFRHAYAEIFQAVVEAGAHTGAFAAQTPSVSAAALVGVIAEALVGPLSWQNDYDTPQAQIPLIAAIQSFCLRAVGAPLD